MRFLTLACLWAFFVSLPALAQDCDCEKDWAFAVNYLENHYAGFSFNVTDANRLAYQTLKEKLQARAVQDRSSKIGCLLILREYFDFFRDNHLQVRPNDDIKVDEASPASVKTFKESDFFKNWERIAYDSTKIWQYLAQSKDALEGIYDSGAYQIAVMRNEKNWRDYYGIITQSKTTLWEKGQVKLEFKAIAPNNYQTMLYMRDHSMQGRKQETTTPVEAMLADARKIFPVSTSSTPEKKSLPNFRNAPDGEWFQFKVLNDSTTYVHIKTFDPSLQGKFDSIYRQITPIIEQKKHLIIDVRDNGGGSDRCWATLAKYFYTKPIPNEATKYFVSSGIIKQYEDFYNLAKQNEKGYGKDLVKHIEDILKKLKGAKEGTYVLLEPITKKNKWTKMDKIYKTPSKVILMFNRNSASAAEGIILQAMHSDKVLLFGENSGGFITFGNVFVSSTPSGFQIQSATQVTPTRFEYEKTGIPPQIYAKPDSNWIEQTNALWSKIKGK